jgi:hypothetical protein
VLRGLKPEHDDGCGGFHKWGTPKWMVYFMENPFKLDN